MSLQEKKKNLIDSPCWEEVGSAVKMEISMERLAEKIYKLTVDCLSHVGHVGKTFEV